MVWARWTSGTWRSISAQGADSSRSTVTVSALIERNLLIKYIAVRKFIILIIYEQLMAPTGVGVPFDIQAYRSRRHIVRVKVTWPVGRVQRRAVLWPARQRTSLALSRFPSGTCLCAVFRITWNNLPVVDKRLKGRKCRKLVSLLGFR
jgi:hypothetical protein